eukprot:SAG31_NODE_32720_length_352_cov_1.003953_1_plen_58_part_10
MILTPVSLSANDKCAKGASRDSILMLFNCLALCPEDVSPPLEIVRMMFEAVHTDTSGS